MRMKGEKPIKQKTIKDKATYMEPGHTHSGKMPHNSRNIHKDGSPQEVNAKGKVKHAKR